MTTRNRYARATFMPLGAPAPRKRQVKREEPLQALIVEFHRLVVIYPDRAVLFAVANGEARDAVTAGKLAGRRPRGDSALQLTDAELLQPYGQGVLAGVTDLVLATPGPVTDWIEVKVEGDELTGAKRTYLKPAQRVFRDAMVGMGHPHHVIRSVAEYAAILQLRGVATRAVQMFPSGAMRVAPAAR